MDLADPRAKRPAIGKAAYKVRVRNLMKTKKANSVATSHAMSLRKMCLEVIKKKGAAARS